VAKLIATSTRPPSNEISPPVEVLLADDVEGTGDGPSKTPALARPLHGRNCVARTLINWAAWLARRGSGLLA